MVGWSAGRRKPARIAADGPGPASLLRASPAAVTVTPGDSAADDVQRALQRAKYIYVTTYARDGRAGTVPTWVWPHEGHVYFTTQRASLKARRIRDTGRVTVHVGRRDGPAFAGRAEWVDDRPDLEAALLRTYRRKYWLIVPLWMGRYIRKGLGRKTSVLIRVTPDPGPPGQLSTGA